MLKRFVFLFVLLLSAVLLSAPYASSAQTVTAGEFQDFCSSASASEIISRLEQMEGRAINIPALLCAAALNPDPGATIALINAIRNRTFEIGLDDKGKTVLMYAAELNIPEVVIALVEAGADVNTADIEGKKALDYALKNAKITDNTEILKMLGYVAENTEAEASSTDISPIEPEPEPVPIDKSMDVEPDNVVLSKDVKVSDDVETTEPDDSTAYSDNDVLHASSDIEPSEPYEIITSDDTNIKSEDAEPLEAVASEVLEKVESTDPVPTPSDVIDKFPILGIITQSDDPKPDSKPTYESRITPDEFMRMCAGTSSEMVLNAIENRNADVNAKDYYDVTPLMYAAEKNSDPKVIEVLVSHGANINAKDRDGKTALMYAAKSNPSSEIISALALNGININARDNNRMTALMYAARNNNAKVAKALIDAGAEELADKRGWTPLFWAARYTQDPAVIGVLLDAGHDPQIRAHDMATPIDHANKNPRLINTKEFLRLEEESR